LPVVWTADAGGSDTASQATTRAAGDDGGRAVEPRPTTRGARARVSVTNLPGSLGAPGRWCARQPRSPWPLAPVCLPVARTDQAAAARSRVPAA
jgi:hypothetical protein